MKVNFKKFLCISLILILASFSVFCSKSSLKHPDWNEDVKDALNQLITEEANQGNYVVFDFDNTCSIFDIEMQMVFYQLETMSFAFTPDQLPSIVSSGIGDLYEERTGYGLSCSYGDLIADICSAYRNLWEEYGPFTYKGVSKASRKKLMNDPYWQEFATKMLVMYEFVGECESVDVSYPWLTFWFTGMTEEEEYDLSRRSFKKYAKTKTSLLTLTSPGTINSQVGKVSYSMECGISVSKNIRELWKCLYENGIDVWVCSASSTGVIKGAVDGAKMHKYCKGVLAMTNEKDSSGRYINRYDYENGCCYFAEKNGAWVLMDNPIKAQPQGKGKVIAIENALFPLYNNNGPIAGFMDSTGDFNFCTEFDSLRLVVCFNRGTRKVTDGGGLIAELAVYQKETLGYDLTTANKNSDILYVLQGRDENGKRSLRNSNKTLRFGQDQEVLFANENNYTQLNYIISNKMTVREALNRFCIKTSEENSELGFKYGFLDTYVGYKSL